MKIRPLMEQARREWDEVVRQNTRADLVDWVLGVQLAIIEVLRLEALPEVPKPHALGHMHD